MTTSRTGAVLGGAAADFAGAVEDLFGGAADLFGAGAADLPWALVDFAGVGVAAGGEEGFADEGADAGFVLAEAGADLVEAGAEDEAGALV